MVSDMFPVKCVGLERRLDMMSDGFRLMVYVGMDRRLDTMSDRFQLMRCVGLGTRSDMMSGKLQLIEQPGASLGLHLKVEKMSDVVWDKVMHYVDPEMDIGSYAITRASNLVFLGSMALGSRRQRGSGQGSGQGFGQGSG